jgi:hypothetical protein
LIVSEAYAEESLLICKGQRHSIIRGVSGIQILHIVLTKEDGKVVQATVTDWKNDTYTLEKKDVQREKGKKPIYPG